MVNFEFNLETDILFGIGQVEFLGEKIKKYTDSVLLVYGGGSIKRTGIYSDVIKTLKNSGITVKELSGVQPNPRIEKVREGVKLCKQYNLGGVLAVGGGSSIDSGKVIAAGAKYKGDPWDLVTDSSKIESALPVFTVLTAAATGSEMNSAAVISKMDTNEKKGTHSDLFLPKVSVMDPTYTFSVPRKHTAAGIADIMSHTFENYFTNEKGYMQARMAEAILKTCIHYGPVVINNPEDYEARASIMWASSWAINGLLKKGCPVQWSCHSMEHELSAFYDITHGEGLAVITPAWMQYVLSDSTARRFYEYGVNVWGIDRNLSEMEVAIAAIDLTQEFFVKDLKIPETLSELGVTDEKLEVMAERAVRGSTIKGYMELSKDDVLNIYKSCY